MLHRTTVPRSRLMSGHRDIFCRIGRRFCDTAAAALLSGGLTSAAAMAQTAPVQPPGEISRVPSTSLIDPQAQKEADKIKSQTWRSAPVGQKGNWNLDIGTFKEDKSLEQDLRERIDENVDSYSGMRLRLPLKGGKQ